MYNKMHENTLYNIYNVSFETKGWRLRTYLIVKNVITEDLKKSPCVNVEFINDTNIIKLLNVNRIYM